MNEKPRRVEIAGEMYWVKRTLLIPQSRSESMSEASSDSPRQIKRLVVSCEYTLGFGMARAFRELADVLEDEQGQVVAITIDEEFQELHVFVEEEVGL